MLVVEGLAELVVDVHLKEIFGCYGDVVECIIGLDKHGDRRATLVFTSEEQEAKAYKEMNNGFIAGNTVKLSIVKQINS